MKKLLSLIFAIGLLNFSLAFSQCTSLPHQLLMTRVTDGMNITDVIPDADIAALRTISIKKFLNGVEVLPSPAVPAYTTNSTTFFLSEGFSYSINHQKTCKDGTVSHEYWGTFDIPKIEAPSKIDARPTVSTIEMTVPLNNNYATLARYKKTGTTFWYTNPGQNKTDKFTIAPLQPSTTYDLQVLYILADRVTNSAPTFLTVKTLGATLTGLSVGANYIVCTSSQVATGVQIYVNNVATGWYVNINSGSNMLNIGRVLNLGDVVSLNYFGTEYKFPAR